MSKHTIAAITILMAPVYIERGLQALFANSPEGLVATEEMFNEWYADGGTAERIEAHVNLVQTDEVKSLIDAAENAPQADILESVFEQALPVYLYTAFQSGGAVCIDTEIDVVRKSLINFLAKAA